MPATLVVAYPQGSNIDMDYYLNKHLPSAIEVFSKAGLVSWRLSRAVGPEPPYEIMALLEFPSAAHVGAVLAGESEERRREVEADLKNYSRKKPVIWVMEEESAGGKV